ncbi:MAG: AbrB family transcriptional regulator [Parahaliea sp.]
MPVVSKKRQITLPAAQCREAGLEPGDSYECFVDNFGCIAIIKKEDGFAEGMLKHIKPNPRYTDKQSRDGAIDDRH